MLNNLTKMRLKLTQKQQFKGSAEASGDIIGNESVIKSQQNN